MAREALTASAQDELRQKLRAGNLPDALLTPGRQVVLRTGDRKITRDALRADAESVAGGLHESGVKPGDRAAIYTANSLDWVVAYLGVQRAGACAVMINPDYHSAEAEHILRDSEPVLVLTDSPRAATVLKLGFKVVQFEDLPGGLTPPMPPLDAESPAARPTLAFSLSSLSQKFSFDILDEPVSFLSIGGFV